MKDYEVKHQPADLARVPVVHYVGSVEEVVELIQRFIASSEGTLISVRRLPAFQPTTRA